ncbi:MAG: tRNA pseudouridine(38-40) synthase TruA [bacterium]
MTGDSGGARTVNVRLVVQYDGTLFHGFQKQPGVRTVQETLEEALRALLGEPVRVTGASRTDAGVHALGQSVNFTAAVPAIPPSRIAPALARFLPRDLAAVSSAEAPPDFNARFHARRKTYRYVCYRSLRPVPFLRNHALNVRPGTKTAPMRVGCAHVVGEHDFSAFRSRGGEDDDGSAVRTIYDFSIEEKDPFIVFTVEGSGFLYRMVRTMVGTLLEVGLGRRAPGDLKRIIESRERSSAGPAAPPHGLYLIRVEY